jgi:hypothetical protein
MPQMSVGARKHAAKLATRTRRINTAIAAARGIDRPHKKSAKEVAETQRSNGHATTDDRLGSRAFADTDFWTGRVPDAIAAFIDTSDSRRKFVMAAGPGTIGEGLSVWLDFRLGSVKSRGGVADAPILNEFISLSGETSRLVIQVDRLNVSRERSRTGSCLCRIDSIVKYA